MKAMTSPTVFVLCVVVLAVLLLGVSLINITILFEDIYEVRVHTIGVFLCSFDNGIRVTWTQWSDGKLHWLIGSADHGWTP